MVQLAYAFSNRLDVDLTLNYMNESCLQIQVSDMLFLCARRHRSFTPAQLIALSLVASGSGRTISSEYLEFWTIDDNVRPC